MHISSYLLLEAGGTWLANWCEGIFKRVKSYCKWLSLNKNYLKSEFIVTPFLLPPHQNLSFSHISLVMIPQSAQSSKINAWNSFIPNSILSFYVQLSNASIYVIMNLSLLFSFSGNIFSKLASVPYGFFPSSTCQWEVQRQLSGG